MFPKELKALPQWVGFKLPGKEPINPKTGQYAKSNDSTTWGTYDEAVRAVQEKGLDGVGFMFAPPYVGIDLDDCVVNGVLNAFAREVISKCNSYTEFSPSRTGIHILVKGTISAAIKKSFLEVYDRERYFTVTQKPVFPVRPIREVDLQWIEQYRENRKGPIDLAKKLNEIQEGQRNNDFTSIAGSLRARGYSVEEIFELLRSRAKEIDFSEKELLLICNSVGRYTPSQRQIPDGLASSISDFLSKEENVEWISKPVLAAKAIGFIAGLPETNKTWIMIDLAIEAARGGKWLNRFQLKKSRVLFIDQERFKGETQRRFRSIMNYKGITGEDLQGNLFIKVGTTTRIDLQNSFEAFRKELSELRPEIVLIDSFKTFHSKDSLASSDMQLVMERIKELRTEFGCAFYFIHHENKGAFHRKDEDREPTYGDMEGSISIPAAAEIVFTVVRSDNESSFVYQTKNNLGPKELPFLVKVSDVDTEKSKISVEAY